MQKLLSIAFLILLPLSALAQNSDIPSVEPEFFAADQEITITYNVTGTSLASLNEAYIWSWLPDQGIDAPSNINPADSDPTATAPAQFEKITEGDQTLFRISFVPTQFFEVEASTISTIGMLLKGNDWSDGQTSDFVTEVSNGYGATINSPAGNYGFYNAGDVINIDIAASESSTFSFYLDGSIEEEVTNQTDYISSHTVIDDGNAHQMRFLVSNGTDEKEFNFTYIVNPQTANEPTPAGLQAGINYKEDQTSVDLVLTAPGKENVFVIGTFNEWSLDDNYLMKKDGDQFWITINDLIPGQEYQFQYLVDGEIKIADPYTEKIGSEFDDPEIIEDGRYPGLMPYPSGKTSEAIGYIQTDKPQFQWTDDNFQKPANEDLVIYELLVRDFTELRTYQAVTDRLDYLDSLGINAIELMPVMEFEGNLSWGYNPFSMLALDKFYGTEFDFKTLVDEAHNRGIAIILDIALNHQFGRNSLVRLYNEGTYGSPTSENPWFNTSPRHDFNVGYDMNHESIYTQNYVDRVVRYWLEEYHVDGYRYDLSKGFTQNYTLGNVAAWSSYDADRIELLKRIADLQWSVDPDSYVILEHFADNQEERELANYGMMLWGNQNHSFRSLAKANSANVSGLSYESKGWDNPHVIGYMESHDEERVAWDLKNSVDPGSLADQMQRLKLNTALFFMVPGPKMLWQFGEFGYDEELNDDRLGIKPTRWEYLENEERKKLFDVYQSMIKLKTRTTVMEKEDFQWSTSSDIKWVRYDGTDVQIAFIGNFSESTLVFDQQILPAGTWYNYFTGDELEIDGETGMNLIGGEFRILTSRPIENFVDENDIVLANENTDEASRFINVYPNPSRNYIIIENGSSVKNIQLFDVNGRSTQIDFSAIQSGDFQINISHLEAGLYTLSYTYKGNIYQEKIIKY